ncbi:MAG: hypothetical protein V4773_22730 [Verrucomicrobiota bacterium]
MKASLFALAFTVAAVGRVLGAETGFEFSGVLEGGKDVKVALTNKATGATQWVAVGGTIGGYAISSYDAKTDVLTLAKDGQTHRLSLKQGKVAAGSGGANGGKPPPEIERAIMNNLRQLSAASDQYYLENGKTSTTYDEIVGPTKYVKTLVVVAGENYRALEFKQGKLLVVKTANGEQVSYGP